MDEADHAGVCAPEGSVGAHRQRASRRPAAGFRAAGQQRRREHRRPCCSHARFIYTGLAPADDEGRYVNYTRHIERTKSHKTPQAVAIVLPDDPKEKDDTFMATDLLPAEFMEAFVEHGDSDSSSSSSDSDSSSSDSE